VARATFPHNRLDRRVLTILMVSDKDVNKAPDDSSPEQTGDDANLMGRKRTDESLLTERSKADSHFEEKTSPIEKEADERVKEAREQADRAVKTGREEVDRKITETPGEPAVSRRVQRQRDREDAVLKREQAVADSVLQDERAMRRRYLADFLHVEREVTDAALIEERGDSDAIVRGRDDLLATVCHELRTLTASVAINNAILKKDAPPGDEGDRIRKRATSGERMIARMNRLINDLLDVSSLESGTLSIEPDEVDVSDVLLEVVEGFRPLTTAKKIVLRVEHPSEPLRAWLDAGRVHQVLANLISNAIRFTPETGEIVIGVERDGELVHFQVRDTGVGIPTDALEMIFDRYRQVQHDRRGLGLGLHISRGIVEAHGGKIWAESEPEKGSRIHFSLPVAEAPTG
jgi:signal transduction histidine kinase